MWVLSWPEFHIVTHTKEMMLDPDKSSGGPKQTKQELTALADKILSDAREGSK